jgi:hypothetical protein
MIYKIRGYQVMLDADLAKIYQVETKRLNEAVKRNIGRFPPEFMFQLTKDEYDNLRSQFVISKGKEEAAKDLTQRRRDAKGAEKLKFIFLCVLRAFVPLRETLHSYSFV